MKSLSARVHKPSDKRQREIRANAGNAPLAEGENPSPTLKTIFKLAVYVDGVKVWESQRYQPFDNVKVVKE